jgi:glycosyltransferase involved in cell wall biosynthesis
MVSIVFRDTTGRYDGTMLETSPLGGTESTVIRMARELARRGHAVTVYSNCARRLVHEGVTWTPLGDPPPPECDLYVAIQHTDLLGFVKRARRRVIWVLWQPNHLKHYKRLPAMWRYRPIPLLTSLHQVRIYSPVLPRRNPHLVVPHGLPDDIRGLPPLPAPPPPEAIFASNPVRNLHRLVEIWASHIWPRCKNAVLNIYGIHDVKPGVDPWQAWGGRFLPENVPADIRASVRVHPTASRQDLMAAMRRARVMLYLGHKVEAFCFALAEAQALGTPAVIAPAAVLPERVIDGVTGFHRADAQGFGDAALSILTDDGLWRRQHEACLRFQQGLSWAEAAARFENALLSDWMPTLRSDAAPLDRVHGAAPR